MCTSSALRAQRFATVVGGFFRRLRFFLRFDLVFREVSFVSFVAASSPGIQNPSPVTSPFSFSFSFSAGGCFTTPPLARASSICRAVPAMCRISFGITAGANGIKSSRASSCAARVSTASTATPTSSVSGLDSAANISSSNGTVASIPSGSTPPGNGPLGSAPRLAGHAATATALGSSRKGSGSSSSSECVDSSESATVVVSGASFSRLAAASTALAVAHSLRRWILFPNSARALRWGPEISTRSRGETHRLRPVSGSTSSKSTSIASNALGSYGSRSDASPPSSSSSHRRCTRASDASAAAAVVRSKRRLAGLASGSLGCVASASESESSESSMGAEESADTAVVDESKVPFELFAASVSTTSPADSSPWPAAAFSRFFRASLLASRRRSLAFSLGVFSFHVSLRGRLFRFVSRSFLRVSFR